MKSYVLFLLPLSGTMESFCPTCGLDFDNCPTCECPDDAKCLMLCEQMHGGKCPHYQYSDDENDDENDEEEEPDDEAKALMTCGRGCEKNWDVRACCEPNCAAKNSMDEFNACPMKLNTLYLLAHNEYDVYSQLVENGGYIDKSNIQAVLMNKYDGVKLEYSDLHQLQAWFIEEDDEESEEESEDDKDYDSGEEKAEKKEFNMNYIGVQCKKSESVPDVMDCEGKVLISSWKSFV